MIGYQPTSGLFSWIVMLYPTNPPNGILAKIPTYAKVNVIYSCPLGRYNIALSWKLISFVGESYICFFYKLILFSLALSSVPLASCWLWLLLFYQDQLSYIYIPDDTFTLYRNASINYAILFFYLKSSYELFLFHNIWFV